MTDAPPRCPKCHGPLRPYSGGLGIEPETVWVCERCDVEPLGGTKEPAE
jgi:ribosomal protein L37AE/L43A